MFLPRHKSQTPIPNTTTNTKHSTCFHAGGVAPNTPYAIFATAKNTTIQRPKKRHTINAIGMTIGIVSYSITRGFSNTVPVSSTGIHCVSVNCPARYLRDKTNNTPAITTAYNA